MIRCRSLTTGWQVKFDLSRMMLVWYETEEELETGKCGAIDAESVIDVRKGAHTPVMKKGAKRGKDDLYLSVCAFDRTLDLECETPEERTEWLRTMRLLVRISRGELRMVNKGRNLAWGLAAQLASPLPS